MSFLTKPFQKFLLLWTGDFISAIGSGLTSFGLGVYIYQQTGKTSFMALVTLLGFLPSILLSIPAALLSIVAMLGTNLFGSIDRLMFDSKTPHFMQMHSGDLDITQLEGFAVTTEDVESFQIMPFLGIDSDKIQVEGNTLTDSLQDNGFCTQNEQFDFLLDMDGNRVKPNDGKLYVPVFYREKYGIKPGATLLVADIPFKVVGFVRDSQMNSALAYSKRFVVSEYDYAQLVPFGKVELGDHNVFPVACVDGRMPQQQMKSPYLL